MQSMARHEADRHEADRHEADRHEADRHEADRHEADRHKADKTRSQPAEERLDYYINTHKILKRIKTKIKIRKIRKLKLKHR